MPAPDTARGDNVRAPQWAPGPWRKQPFPDDWDVGGPENGNFSAKFIAGADDSPIAAVYGHYPETDSRIANAALIIASPDLYEALREMVEAYWRGSEDSDDEHAPHSVKLALAALAKARGEP